MRGFVVFVLGLSALALSPSAQSQEPSAEPPAVLDDEAGAPMVLELFTSQACPRCPEANVLMAELGSREDVFALSFSVDYWGVRGWSDTFAAPAFTQRQRGYVQTLDNASIYTPQFVFDGMMNQPGSRRQHEETRQNIEAHLAARDTMMGARPEIDLTWTDEGGLQVALSSADEEAADNATAPCTVWLVGYTPGETSVDVSGGPNAHKRVAVFNPVTSLTSLGEWTGDETSTFTAEQPHGDAFAVLVQRDGHGPIVALGRADRPAET